MVYILWLLCNSRKSGGKNASVQRIVNETKVTHGSRIPFLWVILSYKAHQTNHILAAVLSIIDIEDRASLCCEKAQ
ncbi:hypothetical protein SADUNF_Sadunf07G0025700 [Salix dunnii]|uniref:Uncharacterized protein n=1 Tax=Salix dunnii TaxID=1413687 RepID=A0A835MVI5_9ROSI|nr:hypothetical protein SADUNF_Sadunf07G0025700 [Salix dunnii]